MCGIAGMIDLTSGRRPAPQGVVAAMAQAIYHRGPDEEGFLEEPGLHLVNRRLSIVGLADGRQPISNEDQTIWTVFNGEFFDYPEQRALLEKKGHRFRTHTDTELLPHLWEDHGIGMLDQLRGQYAICVWDSRTHEFLIARDRSGICPLFYATVRHDGTDWLLFASEMKALFASGLVTPKADLRGLNHIFTFFAMPGPITVFDGIAMLAPGRYLHIKPGSGSPEVLLQQRVYWQVEYPDYGQEEYGHSPRKVIDEYERLLQAAVNRRLRADVPVVSYLSGGVDSSLVVALANKALGRAIPTFTISIQEKSLNEENEALGVARALGCEPVIVKVGANELRTGYPELIGAAEIPVIDTSCLGLMHLAKSVHANGYKVALTGEGADEWLAGYPWFKINKLTGWMNNIPGIPLGYWVRKLGMKLSGQPMFSRAIVEQAQNEIGGHNGWLDLYGVMGVNKLRFFTPEVQSQVLPLSPYDDLGLNPNLRRWHPFHRQMYLGARIMLPGHLLTSKGDRVAMHSSVEARYAFLDEDLLAYTATLHPRWKLRGVLKDKYVERKVAERWLPREVAHRWKKMFRAPMDSWIESTTGERWIDQVLSPESLRKTGYFDADAVTAARQRLGTMRKTVARTSVEMGLTAVVATQLWHHLYISGELADIPSRLPVRAKVA
ncbi:MAG: asparagine synthase (glutamine-hydrolyzing) [Bacteroidales bacterium]|nr:asparagine synthase (glutamine-hydrolyzing) [Bacteroidales bacterium]